MQTKHRVNIPALTGLRFVAAMMVVIGHAGVHFPPPFQGLGALAPNAMAPFFVLSGFIMWLNYSRAIVVGEPGAIAQFAVARIARLWPMYLVALALAVAIVGPRQMIRNGPDTLYFLVGLQSWFQSSGAETLAILIRPAGHLWSISVELFLYVCFPVIVILLSRLGGTMRISMAAIANIAAAVLAYTVLYFHANNIAAVLGSGSIMWLSYYSPYFHLFEFIAGCTACQLFFSVKSSPSKSAMAVLAWLSVAALAAIVVLFSYKDDFGEWAVLGSVLLRAGPLLPLSFLLFYLARYGGVISKALSWRWIMLGGEASYSIYLLQQFAVDRLPPAIAIPLTLAVAFVTYTLIEVPARKWIRKPHWKYALTLILPAAPAPPADPPVPAVPAVPAAPTA